MIKGLTLIFIVSLISLRAQSQEKNNNQPTDQQDDEWLYQHQHSEPGTWIGVIENEKAYFVAEKNLNPGQILGQNM